MKVKVFLILVGVAALHLLLIAGFAITGGCKGPEVFAERRYIPVEGGAAPTAAATETKPEVKPEVKAEAVTKEAPLVPDLSMEKPVAPVKSAAAGKAITGSSYTVQSGDTLGKIAKKAGVSVSALAAANNMTTQKPLKIGQTLTIPGGSAVAASTSEEHKKPVHKKKTEAKKDVKAGVKGEEAKKDDTKKDDTKAAAAKDTAADSSAYTVKQGDNIWTIAKKLKVKATDLAKANNLSTKANLKVGQKLVVPGAAKKSDATPAEATADKKADAAADDILKNVSDPTAKPVDPTAKPVDATTPAPAEAKAAPGAANAAPAAAVAPIGKTDTVEVSKDIEIGKFAQQYGIKVDDIKKLNTDLPKDGILKAGKIIIIPSAE
ncbi:MAG: LysM peptidoglycan-binding domain-containing protein [Victivallaceae bacterium]